MPLEENLSTVPQLKALIRWLKLWAVQRCDSTLRFWYAPLKISILLHKMDFKGLVTWHPGALLQCPWGWLNALRMHPKFVRHLFDDISLIWRHLTLHCLFYKSLAFVMQSKWKLHQFCVFTWASLRVKIKGSVMQ